VVPARGVVNKGIRSGHQRGGTCLRNTPMRTRRDNNDFLCLLILDGAKITRAVVSCILVVPKGRGWAAVPCRWEGCHNA
jgi:hypothetical protein